MKRNKRAIFAALLALLLVGGMVAFNKMQTAQHIQQQKESALQRRAAKRDRKITVQVVEATPSDQTLTVTGYGEVSAHETLTLASQVSGRISEISPLFASGRTVKKGTVLARVEDSSYRKTLAGAKADLASAEQSLLEEQRQGAQAKREWKRSGLKGRPDALVLRTPQLKAAQAAVDSQKQAVAAAQYDLDQTTIRAPFSGIITSRSISLGAVVQNGTTLGAMESDDYAEARILLSELQWQGLPDYADTALADGSVTWAAQLRNDSGLWSGRVSRSERHIESDSRQRALIVQVDAPFAQQPPLYPGSFVTAEISGKTLKGVWKLPVSTLFQGRSLWYVDGENRLQEQAVTVLFSQGESLYIKPFGDGHSRIVLAPLNYFTAGTPVTIKGEEQTTRPAQKKSAPEGEKQKDNGGRP